MKSYVTDILEALGLMGLAAGFAAAVYPVLGLSCMAVAGGVLLVGSWIASREPKHKGVNE